MGQTYRDLVVGSIAWVDYNKTADFVYIGVLLIALFVVGLLALRGLKKSLPSAAQSWLVSPWTHSVSMAMAVTALVMVFIQDQVGFAPQWETIAGLSGTAALLFAWNPDGGKKPASLWPAFFSAVHLALAVLALVSFINWCLPGAVSDAYLWPLAALSLGTGFASKRWVTRLRWAQLALPLLLLRTSALPLSQGEEFLTIGTRGVGTALLWLAIAGLTALLYRDLKRRADPATRWPALFAAATYIAHVTPAFSPLALDDFHFGELALPWHQIVEKGRKPYSEFVPIQGWLGFFSGLVNALFYGGTIGTLLTAKAFGEACVAGCCAVLASRILGVGAAWILIPALHVFPEAGDRLLLVLPFTLLLWDPAVTTRPTLRFFLWPFLAVIHCLYNAPGGIAWTVATSPLVYFGWPAPSKKQAAWAIAAFGIFLLCTFSWWWGWLGFVRTNGASNGVAYGLGILQFSSGLSSTIDNPRARIFVEILRSGGWVFAIGLGVCFAYFQRAESGKTSQRWLLGTTLAALPVLLMPYTLGRMDPFVMSRTGVASLVLAGMLGSFACLWALQRWPGAPVWSAALGICLGYSQAFFPLGPRQLLARAATRIEIPKEMVRLEGSEFQLPRLGTVFATKEKWADVLSVRQAMHDFKTPEQGYLDLTNRSALYAYLDETCPVPLAADYHAFNEPLQTKNLRALQASPPTLVWLGPGIRHDGGPASLRNYRVYRWLMESGLYALRQRGANTFLVHVTQNPNGPLDASPDAEQMAELDKVFLSPTFSRISEAWGRNWENLRARFSVVLDTPHPPALFSSQQPNRVVASLEDSKLAQPDARADYFLLDVGSDQPIANEGEGRIRWKTPGDKSTHEVRFLWKPGLALVPVGSAPAWLKAKKIEDLEIELSSQPAAQLRRAVALRLIQ